VGCGIGIAGAGCGITSSGSGPAFLSVSLLKRPIVILPQGYVANHALLGMYFGLAISFACEWLKSMRSRLTIYPR
jgi:hypothetical protein